MLIEMKESFSIQSKHAHVKMKLTIVSRHEIPAIFESNWFCIVNNFRTKIIIFKNSKMSRVLSTAQRVEIVELYRGNSCKETARIFNERNPDRSSLLNERTVRKLAQKYLQSGSLQNVETPIRTCITTTEASQDRVLRYFEENPHSSLREASVQLNLCVNTVRKILKIKKFHPYKYQRIHRLFPQDPENRMNFANTFLQQFEHDPGLMRRILFSDESIFLLHGVPNKQNYRYTHLFNPVSHHLIEI